MCHLLQYLCDCQVRHRIEAVVAFSDDFIANLQENQRFRYNEVMQALNMSAALTARKTKEFRSPPQEQVCTESPFSIFLMPQSVFCVRMTVCVCVRAHSFLRLTCCSASRMRSRSVPVQRTSENICCSSMRISWHTVVQTHTHTHTLFAKCSVAACISFTSLSNQNRDFMAVFLGDACYQLKNQ